ncbi:hypothetical protein PACTADRAFT_16001 [Pachysolen tannophilus NRRL Y-2460]|uniref:Aminotransferase class V domain-containing protein n=1 Tax=Pachysolen tannophilus NRRL Y-2460 TaxID=669874 RepID=A0A1E4TVQ6_PACTA|nr:hypothetical protein PACTADRAFT_16001 [Pachysolen tannophilus NRRL Y-2460]
MRWRITRCLFELEKLWCKVMTAFGKEFREKYYSFEEGVVPVNNGSFGAIPKYVRDALIKNIDQDYKFPDRYLKDEGRNAVRNAAVQVAKVVDADPNNLVFVTNATTAVNTILRSYPFKKNDKILIQSTTYGACNNTVKFLAKKIGIEIVIIQLNYPLTDDEVISKFKSIFEKNEITLALFDAVSSMPGVRLPFEKIIQLCHEYNVLSLVDGAHSIGLIPYSLNTLKPDFYCSNLHKWFSCPRGCAFLYVDKKHHKKIHTLPVSHSYLDDDYDLPTPELEEKRLIDRFAYIGTMSLAPYVTAIDAIFFRNEICGGEDVIRNHNHNLALKVAKLVSTKWGTSYLENKDNTLITSMVSIEVPLTPQFIDIIKSQDDYNKKLKSTVEDITISKYKTRVPLDYHNGKLYARFSSEVYNCIEDYEYASDALLKAIDQVLASLM